MLSLQVTVDPILTCSFPNVMVDVIVVVVTDDVIVAVVTDDYNPSSSISMYCLFAIAIIIIIQCQYFPLDFIHQFLYFLL